MGGRRRDRVDKRVTIGDLARMYDQRQQGRGPGSSLGAAAPTTRFGKRTRTKGFTVTQGDERLHRLKARVDGIRYALTTDTLTVRQKKELEQTLHNLELAIKGMELNRRDGEG